MVKGGTVGVTVRNPVSAEPVVPYKVVSSTQYEDEQAIQGFYSVCLDNESGFATKAGLYYIYIILLDIFSVCAYMLEK